jgi:hypothetical protein
MRQVQDTLVWLGMILVVAAVVYTMPRVAKLVAARSEQAPPRVNYSSNVSVSHFHPAIAHRHHRDR